MKKLNLEIVNCDMVSAAVLVDGETVLNSNPKDSPHADFNESQFNEALEFTRKAAEEFDNHLGPLTIAKEILNCGKKGIELARFAYLCGYVYSFATENFRIKVMELTIDKVEEGTNYPVQDVMNFTIEAVKGGETAMGRGKTADDIASITVLLTLACLLIQMADDEIRKNDVNAAMVSKTIGKNPLEILTKLMAEARSEQPNLNMELLN